MTTANTTDELELKLLADDEPEPVDVLRPDGASPFFLTCDHAGRIIPKSLGRLGLPESELERHIAWDIGIRAVSERIADVLDTTAHHADVFAPRDRLQPRPAGAELDLGDLENRLPSPAT